MVLQERTTKRNLLLKECSEGVRLGIEHIEKYFNERKPILSNKIKNTKKLLKNKKLSKNKRSELEGDLERLQEDYVKPDFTDSDAEMVVILSQIDSSYKEKFVECSNIG